MNFRVETYFYSPASLAEGGGGKGAGGGLGIKPHYNLAYDESNKSLVFYPLTPLRSRQIGITLPAECTIPPPYLDVHWTSLHPPQRRGRGVGLCTWIVPQDDGGGKEES